MRGFSFSNLRSRLLLLVLLALIPALALILYTDFSIRQSNVARAHHDTLRIAQIASRQHQLLIEGARHLLLGLAQIPQLRTPDPSTCAELLANVLVKDSRYANFGLAHPDGHIFCSVAPLPQPVNVAAQNWFQQAKQSDNFVIGDYHLDPITQKYALTFGYPLLDSTGQLEAVLFATLDLAWFDQLAAAVDLPADSAMTAVDQQGTILTRYPDPARWIGRTIPEAPVWQEILAQQGEGSAEVPGFDGLQRLYAFTPLFGTAAPQRVFVAVGIPTSVALAETNWLTALNLTALGGVTLLAMLAAWVGSDLFFLRRVKTLVNATRQLAAGDLSVRSGLAGQADELGQLGQSFDEMAERLQAKYTEVEQTTATLQQYYNHLEEMVATRTQELMSAVKQLEREISERERVEAELQQAKQSAETANRAKSEFLTHMSHEFRTPLNGIMGYAQLLQREARWHGDAELAWWQEGLTIIQRSGEHLLTLVNDILDLSKIEAGRLDLHPMAFRLNEFLQMIADMGRLQAEQKGLIFEYALVSPLPPVVMGDPRRLRQILLNLLSNAVKFTEQGRVTFTVGVMETDGVGEPDSHFRFEVADTGIGVAPEQLEEIFQPFRRVDEQHYFEGTGLGLPISRKLAELMGGEVCVQSRPGQGSVFWLDVRLANVADWIEPGQGVDIAGYEGHRRKILVVDDNRDNRGVLVSLLAPLGFEVAEAVDGPDGLRQAHEFQPDLILLDLIMPGLSGLDVARQIRQSPALSEVLIIAVSASAFGITRQQSLAAGCNDFLAKPVDVALVLDMLQRYLRLTWVYGDAEMRGREKAVEGEATFPPASSPHRFLASSPPLLASSLVGPPPGEAALLFELALMGDVGEIRARVNRLEQADDRLAPFATVVRHLAKTFEMEKICDLVKLYMEEGYGT